MSNRPKNGHRQRSAGELRAHQIVQPAGRDLGATTTVAIATSVKIAMAQPPQLEGRPCVLLTFVNGDQEFTPPLLLVDGIQEFGETYARCAADVAKIIGEMVPAGESAIFACDACGTRIFGDRIGVGRCLACEKTESSKAAHPSWNDSESVKGRPFRLLEGKGGDSGE